MATKEERCEGKKDKEGERRRERNKKLNLVPILHPFLFLAVERSRSPVREQVDLLRLALDGQVMAVLALEPFRALSGPVKLAHDGFRVDARRELRLLDGNGKEARELLRLLLFELLLLLAELLGCGPRLGARSCGLLELLDVAA